MLPLFDETVNTEHASSIFFFGGGGGIYILISNSLQNLCNSILCFVISLINRIFPFFIFQLSSLYSQTCLWNIWKFPLIPRDHMDPFKDNFFSNKIVHMECLLSLFLLLLIPSPYLLLGQAMETLWKACRPRKLWASAPKNHLTVFECFFIEQSGKG